VHKKRASGGEVSHLESILRLRFTRRSSGQSAIAFGGPDWGQTSEKFNNWL